jgi:FkbM family methyltransferase
MLKEFIHHTIWRSSYHSLKRMARALQGRDLWQGVQTQCQQLWLGNEGARWCICPEGLSAASTIYSCGVGKDISFDVDLIRRFGVSVHAFDPTPECVAWIHKQALPTGFIFHNYGIADFDGHSQFLPPENPEHVSHTILQRASRGPGIEVPVHRLKTIMGTLGHQQVDLLKMDVEGAEYSVLADLLHCGLAVKQILVEFHHRWPEVGVRKTQKAIVALNRAGYKIFNVSPGGEEYSFQRTGS